MGSEESKCFLKRRQRKSQGGSGIALELTPAGRVLAERLRLQALHGTPRGPLLASDGSGGPVKLLIDFREGGGEKHKLFDLCRDLELQGVPFEVRSLPVGDFLFQAAAFPDRCAVFPVIIERKTAEDLALSLIDGRWESQKGRMLAARGSSVFSAGAAVELCYVIEGNLKKAKAGCCPRGCLSRCGGPTLEEVRPIAQSFCERIQVSGVLLLLARAGLGGRGGVSGRSRRCSASGPRLQRDLHGKLQQNCCRSCGKSQDAGWNLGLGSFIIVDDLVRIVVCLPR